MAARMLTQPFIKPPLPDVSFEGQTIIVTGVNVGLGLEAAVHFLRMGASRVIGTCRSKFKCEQAKVDITKKAGGKALIEVWELDYCSYASVKGFCERVDSALDRLDAVVLNAAIGSHSFEVAEGDEIGVTVNVISTILLAALLIPTLQRSAEKYGSENTLAIVSSEIHKWARFPERNEVKIVASMSDPQTKTMSER